MVNREEQDTWQRFTDVEDGTGVVGLSSRRRWGGSGYTTMRQADQLGVALRSASGRIGVETLAGLLGIDTHPAVDIDDGPVQRDGFTQPVRHGFLVLVHHEGTQVDEMRTGSRRAPAEITEPPYE
jgi:hypothetical protein